MDGLDIGPVCAAARHGGAEAEHDSEFQPRFWEVLRNSALNLAGLPAEYGGLGTDVPSLVSAVREVSRVDAAAGWVCAIHVPAATFTTFLVPSAASEIVTSAWPPLIGGASMPAGHASPAPDGYRLTGCWPLVTGGAELTWACLAALVHDGDRPRVLWFFVPGKDLVVERDWDAIGMRGTGSHSVRVDDVFVPVERAISLTDGPVRLDSAVSRFPIYGLMAACIAAVALGIFDRAWASFTRLSSEFTPRNSAGRLAEQPFAQYTAAQSVFRMRSAEGFLRESLTATWSAAESGAVGDDHRLQIRAAANEVVAAAAEGTQQLYDASGVAGIYRRNELERCLRDMLVVKQHAVVGASAAHRVGRALLLGGAPVGL
jgi:alkylation response protein AidB-like acyl-CoA dehydrogenase